MGPVCANWKGLELLLPLPTCGLMSTSKDHEATPSLSIWGRGSQPAIRFPLFLKAGPPKNTLFWRNRALFPVASRSNPRCSKAQIASYLAQRRRFLAPTAWASSASTTKKISPQPTQAWFRACFLGQWLEKGRGCPWHACGTIGWNNTMTWEESNLYISPYPWIWRSVPTPAGIAEAHWQAKGMPGRSCRLPPIPLFLKFSESGPPKNNLFWRNRAFFPVASRSNPRCSKAQIASYWAQIGRFLALAPQRMSHLLFFGDNVNVSNFWISLKKPVIIIS